MALEKKEFKDDEEALFDNVVICKSGDFWHMRPWLPKEHKYACLSIKTQSKSAATDKAELHYRELKVSEHSGKTYFSKPTKPEFDLYPEERAKDVEPGIIVNGRFSAIRNGLYHWLSVIGKDTKLKELERTDCENYFLDKKKAFKNYPTSQSTVENEQSILNAMIKWLHRRNETYITGFNFQKLKRPDIGAKLNRRSSFSDYEIGEN